MVEHVLAKDETGVRFSLSAQNKILSFAGYFYFVQIGKSPYGLFVEDLTVEYITTERNNNEPCPATISKIRVSLPVSKQVYEQIILLSNCQDDSLSLLHFYKTKKST